MFVLHLHMKNKLNTKLIYLIPLYFILIGVNFFLLFNIKIIQFIGNLIVKLNDFIADIGNDTDSKITSIRGKEMFKTNEQKEIKKMMDTLFKK